MENASDSSPTAQASGELDVGSSSQSAFIESPLNWEPLPECLGHWTGFVLHWVSDLGAQYYARAIAPLGLSPLQVGILQVISGEGPTRQARLGDKLRVDKATMVTLLNNLEAQGLVERRPHPSDRRAYNIHLLEAGRDRLQAAEQASIAAADEFFSALTPSEQHTLNELLRRIATRPL
ncbi:MarR family winged helix-turn-helix transcriptional regulator [Leptolyngbya sp. CCNP1308]|uniref:MarR family winged helix-turn-helix transcriptional regulator n=1 Tax=Leptolyngbya sp. CCNP1308 TaxID=3110255 RepID=UPI002B1F7F28|nr:MarR family winged helix-turn-helix transcriptional regulator [Leptolyngbya sp. CCNP1308]MEA5450564.1 MarR family winged helix-turn-helix transcriptional regulator [Leptolyngbya sp. CCNP1308]